MDLSAFKEWRMVEVVRRPTEDATFYYMEYFSMRAGYMTELDREVLNLEHKCLRIKPHFAQSLSARATWIKDEYNRKHGYGLGARQVNAMLLKCSAIMHRESVLERN